MKDIVEEEGLQKYIQLNTEVTSAIWNEESSRWCVRSSQKIGGEEKVCEEQFHYLVNASGFLK